MAKTAAQLNAEIAEALRAKAWQDRIEREEIARRARVAALDARPSREQLYNEQAADRAAGVFHGEQRGRSRDFRKA